VEVQSFANEALTIDKVVTQAVAEYSLNPANIETEIHKHLLPSLFKLSGTGSSSCPSSLKTCMF